MGFLQQYWHDLDSFPFWKDPQSYLSSPTAEDMNKKLARRRAPTKVRNVVVAFVAIAPVVVVVVVAAVVVVGFGCGCGCALWLWWWLLLLLLLLLSSMLLFSLNSVHTEGFLR